MNDNRHLTDNYDDVEFVDSKTGRVDEFWKPTTPGDQVTGKYIGSFDGNLGPCYMLESNGKVVGLPSNAGIVNNFQQKKIGTIVRITYEGTGVSEKNGQTYYKFRIQDGKLKTEI